MASPPWAPSLRMMPSLTCQPAGLPLMIQPSRFLPLKRDAKPASSSARALPANAALVSATRSIKRVPGWCMGFFHCDEEDGWAGRPSKRAVAARVTEAVASVPLRELLFQDLGFRRSIILGS